MSNLERSLPGIGLRVASALLTVGALLPVLAGCGPSASSGDPEILFTGGNVYSLVGTDAPAGALAVRGDAVLEVGDEVAITGLAGDWTQQMELDGETILPGFHDRWIDVEAVGRWSDPAALDLRLASTRSEVQAMVRNAAGAADGSGWIVGWGWDESGWPDPTWPHRRILDAVGTDAPIVLHRRAGRVAWASGAALEAAGIGPTTRDPAGGRILRDADGAATGILVGRAVELVESVIPPVAEERREEWIVAGLQAVAAAGITTVATAPLTASAAQRYVRLAGHDRIPVRVQLRLHPGETPPAVRGAAARTVSVAAVGVDLDGPLAARLAAVGQAYPGRPDDTGFLALDAGELAAAGDAARSSGLALHVQARGDRAIDLALATLEGRDDAWIVGFDAPGPDAVERLGSGGVGTAIVPLRFAAELYWLEERLGAERADRAHPFRAIRASGAPWGVASAAPAYPLRPLAGLLAAYRRTDADGYPAGGWRSGEAVGPSMMLRAMAGITAGGRGLTAGAPADLVIWSEDPMTADDGALLRAQPLVTVVAGRVVFSRALVDLPMTSGQRP